MTDIHTHILWSLDDGPRTIDESVEMLAVAFENGTTDIVATPHANPRYQYSREVTLERIAELTQATDQRPRIHCGCEFHLTFDNVEHLMQNLRTYTINQKQYLLVECPDEHIAEHTESILRRMVDAGIVPIIAHPERNPVLRHELTRVEAWVELGCLMQVTAMSLTGSFGKSAQTASYRLLDRGLIHMVASDCHDLVRRNPRLTEARDIVSSRCGEDAATILFTENPRAVVEGVPLPGGKQNHLRPPARWYNFWKTT